MLEELKEIYRTKGREGLLPQNLPSDLVEPLSTYFSDYGESTFKHFELLCDPDVIKESDQIHCIFYLIETLTGKKLPPDVFAHYFEKAIYHYLVESVRRKNNIDRQLLTVQDFDLNIELIDFSNN